MAGRHQESSHASPSDEKRKALVLSQLDENGNYLGTEEEAAHLLQGFLDPDSVPVPPSQRKEISALLKLSQLRVEQLDGHWVVRDLAQKITDVRKFLGDILKEVADRIPSGTIH